MKSLKNQKSVESNYIRGSVIILSTVGGLSLLFISWYLLCIISSPTSEVFEMSLAGTIPTWILATSGFIASFALISAYCIHKRDSSKNKFVPHD